MNYPPIKVKEREGERVIQRKKMKRERKREIRKRKRS